MKTLFFKICLSLLALVFSASVGFSLPACPSTGYLHNCFGTFTWADGDEYVGEWKDNNFHGQGTYTFRNGEKYQGDWRDGRNFGQGTYTYSNGEKYVGEWKDNKKNGQGNYTYPNGEKYVGEWKDDENHGQGTYTYANGDKYVGEFRDGKTNGQGYYIFADGKADFCTYLDDEVSNCSGSNVYDVAPILLQKFRSLPEYQRKRVQTNLRSQGLHSSSIDGNWSENTFVGLASYAALNLNTIYINSSFQANRLLNALNNAQTTSIANTCTKSPKACENFQLCTFATKIKNGKKIWQTHSSFTQYAAEAKRRGLSCGVNSGNAALDDGICGFGNFSACTSNELCKKATNASSKWQSASNLYVKEAKRRGLSCGVNSDNAALDDGICGFGNFSACTSNELCKKATNESSKWQSASNLYVKEAKRRGLSCGVTTTASTSKTCSQDPKFCGGTHLCQIATRVQSGMKVWVNNQHAVHAQRVGLSCGVLIEKEIKEVTEPSISSPSAALVFAAKTIYVQHLDSYTFDPFECAFGGTLQSDEVSLDEKRIIFFYNSQLNIYSASLEKLDLSGKLLSSPNSQVTFTFDQLDGSMCKPSKVIHDKNFEVSDSNDIELLHVQLEELNQDFSSISLDDLEDNSPLNSSDGSTLSLNDLLEPSKTELQKNQLEQEVKRLSQSLEATQQIVDELEVENNDLNTEIKTLRAQVEQLNSLLKIAKDKEQQSNTQIQNLGNRLNSALAKAASEERKRRKLEESLRNQVQQMNEEIKESSNNSPSKIELGADLTPKDDLIQSALQEAMQGGPEPTKVKGAALTKQEIERLRDDVQACWIVDQGSPAAKVSVTVAMSLTPEGKVKGESLRLISGGDGSDQAVKLAYQGARRAILRCQKQGYDLPKDKYEYWKEIQITFRP